MGWTGVWATLVTALLFLNSAAAADRWDLQYFYDKNDSSLAFTDLSFSSAQHGAALGLVTERDHQRPVVALTYDGGRNWTLVSLKEAAVSLFFTNDLSGWLAGAKNHLWKTQDGGRTWKSAAPKGVRADVLRVFFLDESRGWLLCSQKQIYSTNDGGRSWQLLEASRRPDPPDANTFYTWAAFQQETGLLTGWSRPPERRSEILEWIRPELRPPARHPTTAVILHTADGGRSWNPSVLRNFGEIVRARILPSGAAALLLVQRPDSLASPSAIVELDPRTLQSRPVYQSRTRWLTDLALMGPGTTLAAAVDQEGRAPFPAIPSKLKILRSTGGNDWAEMQVDYRAEAGAALLAAPDSTHAWAATDTGMILTLVKD